MTPNLRTTVVATGLALAFSLYAPAQQGQTGTGAQTGGNRPQATPSQPQTTPQSGTAQPQSGRSDAASSSRNRIEEPKSMVGPAEQRFINEAAAGSMAEIQMAQLAQKKAESEQVKSLAQKIEQDHTNASNELKAVAEKRGVTLPANVDPKHQQHMDRLSKLEGSAFDRQYARLMVSEHKKDVSKFERASNNLMDTDLRNFATKTLPNLREHLRMAQEAANQKSSGTRARTTDNTAGTSTDTTKPDTTKK